MSSIPQGNNQAQLVPPNGILETPPLPVLQSKSISSPSYSPPFHLQFTHRVRLLLAEETMPFRYNPAERLSSPAAALQHSRQLRLKYRNTKYHSLALTGCSRNTPQFDFGLPGCRVHVPRNDYCSSSRLWYCAIRIHRWYTTRLSALGLSLLWSKNANHLA